MDKLKIFISGTENDMLPEREAVARAVDATTLATSIRAEAAVSQPQSPRAWIEQQLRECNIYIGVYSHRYGWVIPEEDRSATEYEFDLATQLKRPILIWIRRLQEHEKNLPDFKRQEQFLRRVSDFSRGRLRQEFDGAIELQESVAEALSETFFEIIESATHEQALAAVAETGVQPERLGYRGYAEKLVADLKEWERRYAPMFARFEKLDLFGQLTSTKSQPEPLLELIKKNRSIVVLGVAGAGKTTTLRRVALESAQSFLARERDALIPAMLSLRDYGPPSIMRLLGSKFHPWGLTFDEVVGNLDLGRFLLIFDGLNEVAAARRDDCYNELRHLIETYPRNHFIFTAREFGYRDDCLAINEVSHPTCKILPLTRGQIEEYIRRYFHDREHKAVDLIARLKLHDDAAWDNPAALIHLAKVPLLLQMLILTFETEGHIPRNQGDLLLRFVTDILTKVEPGKAAGKFRAELKLQALSGIAWEMQHQGLVSAAPIAVAWGAFVSRLKKLEGEEQITSRHEALEVWHEIQNNNLLIVERGTVLWPHPLFQDLFVGMEVQSLCFDPLWRPRKEEIFFRFSPLRAKWFGEPWFEYGILMLETIPPDYRLPAMVTVSGCNPELVWQAFTRMEPEYHPDLREGFVKQLWESCLSSGYGDVEYRNFVKTLAHFDAQTIFTLLHEIARHCPAWDGREEALYVVWSKYRSDAEKSTVDFVESIAVTDAESRIRKSALDFLTRSANGKLTGFLLERLLAETTEVAEYLFAAMGKRRVAPVVLATLEHVASSKLEDLPRRNRAVWAIGESGTTVESARQLLCKIARYDANAELRRAAVRGLRNFPSRTTLNALKHTLKDANRLVRLQSIASLNSLRMFNVAPVLISVLADGDDDEVVTAAKDSLIALAKGKATVSIVAAAANSDDPKVKRRALSVLATIANKSDDQTARSARKELLIHSSERDRESLLEVASGLIHYEPQVSNTIFRKLLGDKRQDIRKTTRERIEQLGIGGP